MTAEETLWSVISARPDAAPAICAPGRAALDFGGLKAQMRRTVEFLNQNGVGRGDRVAILLPNGPEMAAAFIAIGAGAGTAPLNPAYREDEFDFYLGDLKPRALVIEAGMDSPARAVAKRRTVPVIELAPEADKPGGAAKVG